jgi:hypothetical protein
MSHSLLRLIVGTLILGSTALVSTARADDASIGQFNVHGGLGLDALSGGAAINLGIGYRLPIAAANWGEGAFDVYHHSSEDQWVEGNHEGVESSEFTVVAARFNMLFGYEKTGVHPIVGFGLFAASVYWQENEHNIVYPDIQNFDDFEGTVFGNIFNFGVGIPLSEKADLRFEAPIMIFWGAEGNSVGLPITVSTGLRF